MAELAIDREFLRHYGGLPRPVRHAVDAAIGKLAAHTRAGLHPMEPSGARDPHLRTIHITDSWRAVVLALGDGGYLLKDVLSRDDADGYAATHVFSVNQALGVLEVRDQAGIDDLARTLPPEPPVEGLFDRVSNADLRRLGVAPGLFPLLPRISSADQLDSLCRLLPEAQRKALTGLAAGMPPDEVWRGLAAEVVAGGERGDVDSRDLAAAARRTPDRIAFVSGPVELAAILARPFDLWRTFLHPTQRDVAYREVYTGPALVTGGTGTGKTVTGLHRAVFLARRLPDGGSKVLLTTFTRALAEALARRLFRLTDDPAVRSRIDVVSIDKLAYEIVARGRKITIVDDDVLDPLWDAAAAAAPPHQNRAGRLTRFSGVFLRREWEQVVLAQGLRGVEAYQRAKRIGRGEGLRAAQRDQVWGAIQGVTAELARRGLCTHTQLADEAAEIAARSPTPYRHVVVDEGQDLHPAQWRLLRALVAPGPNDLFLLADPHQRSYDSQVSLARLGIEVRGRAHRLTVNYRTTHGILQLSMRMLGTASTLLPAMTS